MEKLEKERRFLIELPLNKEALDNLPPPITVLQTYLKNENGLVERVRHCSVLLMKQRLNHYYHTTKAFVEAGINKENENDIQEKEYFEALKRADEDRFPIEKTRYYIQYQEREFDFDIFGGDHKGLAILEIELQDLNEEVELPPFLKVIREITGESEYSNYNLAKKK